MAKASRVRREKSVRRVTSCPRLRPRARDAHKGDFGRVLVIGGSRRMVGAPALAGLAALRGGAGLATIACPEAIQLSVAALCPCATTIPLPQSSGGTVNPSGAARGLARLGLFKPEETPSAVVGGPGLGRGNSEYESGLFRLWQAFCLAGTALILDADALNALGHGSGECAWTKASWPRTVITPHPGELARMHGTTSRAIQSDREGWALRTARELGAHGGAGREPPAVVLKGAGTIVTDGARVYVNKTGNPGMATGGSGDVLAGLIAAMIAQGLDGFDASVLGVRVHGLAGDMAAKSLGEASMIATDLIEYLPAAMKACR